MTIFADLHMPKLQPGVVYRFPQWTPDDGPAPYVWSWLPPGSRFLGSYVQSTSHGLIRPRDIGLDALVSAQAIACIEDWIAQGRTRNQVNEIHDLLALQKRNSAHGVLSQVAQLIYTMSEGNLEVICPWDPPGKIWVDIRAPGWDKLKAAI